MEIRSVQYVIRQLRPRPTCFLSAAEPFNLLLPRIHTNFAEWLRYLRGKLDAEVFVLV